MEVKPHTLIKGDIYYSCGENSCKPKRMYAQFGVEQEANSQKETFHLSLSDVTQKKHVRKKAIWRHHDFCGIVDGDLTLPMTGCWFRGQKRSKMTYIAMCLEGKTIMLFSKDQPQQTINGNTLSKWKQTLFGAMKCVANWYVVYTGSTVHVADLEEGSQVTLALTESGLGLLSNSLEMTSRPPHSVRRWSLSHVRCEQQDDNIVKLYAKENGIKGEYTFRTNHCVAVVKAVAAAHANYVRSRKTSSASSSSETTSWQFTESLYDETEQSRISTESEQDTTESIESEHSRTELETALKMRLSHSDDTHVIPTEHLSVSDDDKRADALLDCCDLTFSRRSRSTGCLASNTKMNPPDMYDIDRRCRRSHDNLFTASCSCNINDLAADVKRLQNHRAIYSQMNTIVRTAAIHCNSVTSSGVIETVSPLATRRSTLKKRFAKPVVSLTLSLPAQSFDDSVIEGQHSQGKNTQPKERSHSRLSSRPSRFSLYRSISEHDLIQPQSPGDWSAESICRCLNDVLNNHPPLPDTLHLPCKLRIQVCMRLYTQEDDAKGWKALAEKIGLNYDAVMIIQSFQHHHPCRLTAGEIVLRHWQSVFNSCGVDPLKCPVACTKDKLGVLLLEIGRFDLVDLLS